MAPAKRTRLVFIGGFLGAGKTTMLARAALALSRRGLRVGMVTNDQAADLVDTGWLKQQGFTVGEVSGGCFCCRFDALLAATDELAASSRPDIILTEPVGSCTDLSATVLQPFKHFLADRFSVGPLVVLADPGRLQGMFGEAVATMPLEVSYVYRKQLEEADVLVLNKVDQYEYSDIAAARALLAKHFPTKPLLALSGRTGIGFEPLQELLLGTGVGGMSVAPVDYYVYAAGEAALGWLNASVRLVADRPVVWREIVTQLLLGLRDTCAGQDLAIAHLKAHLLVGDRAWHGGLVSTSDTPLVQGPTVELMGEAMLTLNARVAATPEALRALVEHTLTDFGLWYHVTPTVEAIACFSPAFPQPVYRYPGPYTATTAT